MYLTPHQSSAVPRDLRFLLARHHNYIAEFPTGIPLDLKKAQAIANATPNHIAVLSNPTRKHQQIQPT